jgi:hypothetical protein
VLRAARRPPPPKTRGVRLSSNPDHALLPRRSAAPPQAAAELGLRPLEEHCQRRLGQRLEALGTFTAVRGGGARRADGRAQGGVQGTVVGAPLPL